MKDLISRQGLLKRHILGPEDEKVKTIETCIRLVEEIEDE